MFVWFVSPGVQALIPACLCFFQAYATSTQLYNWHFTPSDLTQQRQECNANARKRLKQLPPANKAEAVQIDDGEDHQLGLDPDEEFNIVKRYIYLMKALFDKFTNPRIPHEVYGFAATYLKRFYLRHSVMDFYPREMMLTCLYVACKAADFPIGLQAFIAHIPRNQERYSSFIINSELFLLESLNYDLWVFTPYRPLMGLIIDLLAYQKHIHALSSNSAFDWCPDEKAMAQELHREGVDLISLWYQTDLCLTVHPSQFALAVLVELGYTRPSLDVESFIRDEVCGCHPIQKPTKPKESDDETDDEEEEETSKVTEKNVKISPDDRWKQLSERLAFIRDVVTRFDFVVSLEPMNEEELKLEQCRNPLYNVDSEEYAEAKARADSLLATLE
ncbi:putative cyclin-H [Clonorchis sinensis]|uniref:Cyclin-H n=2 Tax=Clonorchis sinensis TaxID=79923 RepID=A0A8T1MSK1_CLOSI|nr:putative cyclin-H [Clonorchis sinensis]GAA30923.2 probable cyclin-H [Clonorchis sinensis]